VGKSYHQEQLREDKIPAAASYPGWDLFIPQDTEGKYKAIWNDIRNCPFKRFTCYLNNVVYDQIQRIDKEDLSK
jgi:hypothetical protein